MRDQAGLLGEALSPTAPHLERRAATRYPARMSVSCRPAGEPGTTWRARVPNISAFGIGLLLDSPVQPSALLELELANAARGVARTVLVRVVHVTAAERGWLAGCACALELGDAELRLFRAGRVKPVGPDCRRWVRFPCNVETVCYSCDTIPGERTPAQVLNMSPGGIGFLLPCEFAVGTLLHFELPRLPKQPTVQKLVRVVNARKAPKRDWFLGCEFAFQFQEDELRDLLS
jgi:hypothetical protein